MFIQNQNIITNVGQSCEAPCPAPALSDNHPYSRQNQEHEAQDGCIVYCISIY